MKTLISSLPFAAPILFAAPTANITVIHVAMLLILTICGAIGALLFATPEIITCDDACDAAPAHITASCVAPSPTPAPAPAMSEAESAEWIARVAAAVASDAVTVIQIPVVDFPVIQIPVIIDPIAVVSCEIRAHMRENHTGIARAIGILVAPLLARFVLLDDREKRAVEAAIYG